MLTQGSTAPAEAAPDAPDASSFVPSYFLQSSAYQSDPRLWDRHWQQVYERSLARDDEDTVNRAALDDYLRANPDADRSSILQQALVTDNLQAAFDTARADAESRGEEWNLLYIGAERRATAAAYRDFLESLDSESQQAWEAHDARISRIEELDPQTAYEIKKQAAQGDFAGASKSINLFTLRSQMDLVDPQTREKLRLAIENGDVQAGFDVLAADRAVGFKEYTGEDMPDDPAKQQEIWDARTVEIGTAYTKSVKTALADYLQVPGVQEAIDSGDYGRAYALANAGIERQTLDANLLTLRSQMDLVDPQTRDYLRLAIENEDLQAGFDVLAADRASDFKEYTGEDMPDDSAKQQEIWDARTVEIGTAYTKSVETALADYLQVPGVQEAIDTGDYDRAYAEADRAALADYLQVPGVQEALAAGDRDRAYALANAEFERQNEPIDRGGAYALVGADVERLIPDAQAASDGRILPVVQAALADAHDARVASDGRILPVVQSSLADYLADYSQVPGVREALESDDIEGASKAINLFTLRSQLVLVDRQTQEDLRVAIAAGDVQAGFEILAADGAADFKEYTGQDPTGDRKQDQATWGDATARLNQEAVAPYMEVPGVREAVEAGNWPGVGELVNTHLNRGDSKETQVNPLLDEELRRVQEGNLHILTEAQKLQTIYKENKSGWEIQLDRKRAEAHKRLANISAENYHDILLGIDTVYHDGKPITPRAMTLRLDMSIPTTSEVAQEMDRRNIEWSADIIRQLVKDGHLSATVPSTEPAVVRMYSPLPEGHHLTEFEVEKALQSFRERVEAAHAGGKVVEIVDLPSIGNQLLTGVDVLVPPVRFGRAAYEVMTDDSPVITESQRDRLTHGALGTLALASGPLLIDAARKTISGLVTIGGRTFVLRRSGVLEPVTNIRGRPNVVGQADDALEVVTRSGRIDSMTTPRRLLPDEGQAFSRFEAPQLRVVQHPLYGPQLIEERVTYPFMGGTMSARFLLPGSIMRTTSTRGGGPWYPPNWPRMNLPPGETPGLRPDLYPAWRSQPRGGGFGGGGPGGGGATFRTQSGTLFDNRGNIIQEAPHPTSVEATQIRLANLETGVGPQAQYSPASVGTFTGAALTDSGLYLPAGVAGTVGVNLSADTGGEPEPSPARTGSTGAITGTTKALDTTKEGESPLEGPAVPSIGTLGEGTTKPDTDTSSGTGAAQDTDSETAADTGTETETALDTGRKTATDTGTDTASEPLTFPDEAPAPAVRTFPDPEITVIRDVLEAPPEVLTLPQVLTLQQVQLLPDPTLLQVQTLPPIPQRQTLPEAPPRTALQIKRGPADVPEVAPEINLADVPEVAPEINLAEVPEVTPQVFPAGAPPVIQAAETPLGVPLRTPPREKPPPKKKRRRPKLPRIGLDLDDPSLRPSTGGTYPRLLRHTETVEVTTDLDTGLSHVELLKTVSPPRVVGRDSDPPAARPRFSGQQRIDARGQTVRSQPVKKRRKIVHKKLHPYVQYRRDIRRAQRRSGGRQA